jgi:uncharacterized protein (TIGR02217 family)
MIHDVRLPEKWSKGSTGGLEWRTNIVGKASGDEHRVKKWSRPKWRGDIAHNVKSPADISELRAFHLARNGSHKGFLLKDWIDWTSNADGVSPATALDQPLGTGTGALTTFQLVKRYGDVAGSYDRAIFWPVTGTLLIAVDGTPLGGGFSVNRGTGIVTFSVAPADDAVLTAGFQFDVPVRFEDDLLSVSWDTINSRSAGQVPLIEVRS